MPYRYVEHTADAAFEAEAPTLEELFAAAADAVLGVMVEAPEEVGEEVSRRIELDADSEESLLHRFLEELVFLKDAEGLLLRAREVAIEREGSTWRLGALVAGEPADPQRHALLTDVKAVTWHAFRLAREGGLWRASALLDV